MLTLTKSYEYFRFGNGQFAVLILCLTLSDLLVVFCGILGALILEVSLQSIRRGLPFLYSVVTANQERSSSPYSVVTAHLEKFFLSLLLCDSQSEEVFLSFLCRDSQSENFFLFFCDSQSGEVFLFFLFCDSQ